MHLDLSPRKIKLFSFKIIAQIKNHLKAIKTFAAAGLSNEIITIGIKLIKSDCFGGLRPIPTDRPIF